jgi:DNA-binding transcriptional regulator/RsmH inhibitor MraZ
LTPSLIEYAGLEKDALIVGMINKIEIWDPTILSEMDKQNLEIDPAAYDELAEKITL